MRTKQHSGFPWWQVFKTPEDRAVLAAAMAADKKAAGSIACSPNNDIAARATELARKVRAIESPDDDGLLAAVATELERIPHMIEVGTSMAISRNQLATQLAVMRWWRPIATADVNEPAILYSPPEALSDRPDQEADYRVAKPRDFCWATHWMPLPDGPA